MANNDEVPQSSDLWCKTDLNTRKESKGNFTWTISGLLGHRDDYGEGEVVISKEFILRYPDEKETRWILEFVPKYNTNCIQVRACSRNKFEVKTKMQVALVQNNGSEIWLNCSYHQLNVPNLTFIGGTKLVIWCMDWNTLAGRRTNASAYMPNGDLTFKLEAILYGAPKTDFGSTKLNNVHVQEAKDSDNDLNVFGEFYLSKEFSDVLIKCKDKSFEAHQLILSASSPVFRGMFQADMMEKKNQQLEIEDLEPDVVVEMLKWCYTRSCVATEDNPDVDLVSDLLVASNKYQIVTLKNVCQSLLSRHLKVDNSLKVTKFEIKGQI